MPSRQAERRKAAAAAALALANADPVDDWTTQTEDPWALFRVLGAENVYWKAAQGDREAQFSQGFGLVYEADGAAGETEATALGTAGSTPRADVGMVFCTP